MTSEQDVRRWVKARYKGRVWWIEPRSGGTFGLPDCLIAFTAGELKRLGINSAALGSVLTPVELKCSDIKTLLSDKGIELRCEAALRPAQKQVLKSLLAAGIRPVVLVGRRGTVAVGNLDAAEAAGENRLCVWRPVV